MRPYFPPFLALAISFAACGQNEPRIDYGKVECAHCRMNVVDAHFASLLVTQKGRQYVFDDLACMVQYVNAGTVADSQVSMWYVCDHAHPGKLCDATTALYLSGPAFRSPMRGDVAAFRDATDREKAMNEGDQLMDWNTVRSKLTQ